MTTIDSSPDATSSEPSGLARPLAATVEWLTSTDHKKIGRLFIGGGLLGLLAAVAVNLLIAIERLDGDNAALDVDSWVQILSGQRVAMVFGVALPLVAGLSLAVMPIQVGARSLAFPRLASTGVYLWFGGLVLSIVALANNGGFGGGDSDMVDLFLAAHALMAVAFAAVGASLVTTVLTTRAPGMTMRRVPFFSWSTMVFGLGLLLVMPVLLGTLIYLFVDHRSGAREAFGGNEGITSWAGWVFTQPTTFLFAIPALGVFAELLPSTFRKRTPVRGLVFAGLSLVGVAAFAGVTQQFRFELPWQGSDLFLGDSDDIQQKIYDLLPWAMFHLLPIAGAGLLVLMALFLARPQRNDDGQTIAPNVGAGFIFAFFGYGMIMVGMVGAALEPIIDLALINTVFGEATLVYVVYGTVLGVMGGIVHWAPKLWGRELDLKKVAPLALLGVLGTVLASFPHYIAGFLDQPAGLGYTDGDLQIWNILVLVGHALMVLTTLAFIGLLVTTMLGGDDAPAGDDPFDGQTIEWATTSPAPRDNFVDVPMVTSAEPLLDRKQPVGAGAQKGSAN
jgi:heme/copper-type cytochrome/quinol oxidase subunit 1